MRPEFRITIEIPFKSNKEVENALKELKPELDFKGRAKIEIKKSDQTTLLVLITAEDLSSLHAAVGSQLRALKIIKGVQDFAEE